MTWHCHCLYCLQCCHHVTSDTRRAPDAKGHRTGPVTDVSIQSCRHAAAAVHRPHHPHHMADKVRPLETRTGRLHQGRKTAALGNWTLHIYTLQQHCSPAFLLANCSKYLEIYGKLFIAWLLLRPNICLMAVTIFLSRYSLFRCYIQLLVPSAEKTIKYPLGHLVKTLNTESWKCHITS